jgi:Tol biopolymer transport system component
VTQDQPGAETKLLFFNIRKQYELDPDWQPNGGRIIFQRRENDHWEIYSVAPDGSGLRALTFPAFTLVAKLPSNVAPAWSPDGQHIVYLSNRQANQSAGEWRVWVMNADGSNQRPLDIDLTFIYTYVAEQMLDWGR